MRGFLMLAATGEDPRLRIERSAKRSAHLPPTGRQNVPREPIPVNYIPVTWSVQLKSAFTVQLFQLCTERTIIPKQYSIVGEEYGIF